MEALIRWNAMAMVHGQNKKDAGIGGHISTYSSLATLLEVGFNHFFQRKYTAADGPSSRATSSISRATPRPGSMHAPIWKAASTRARLKNFRHELRGEPGCPAIRTPG